MIADEVFMSMVRHFALVMPIVASPWGRRQHRLSGSLCFFLEPLPIYIRQSLEEGNRYDSLRPKANEIENIREESSCESSELSQRRRAPRSGRCIIKYPFLYGIIYMGFR